MDVPEIVEYTSDCHQKNEQVKGKPNIYCNVLLNRKLCVSLPVRGLYIRLCSIVQLLLVCQSVSTLCLRGAFGREI